MAQSSSFFIKKQQWNKIRDPEKPDEDCAKENRAKLINKAVVIINMHSFYYTSSQLFLNSMKIYLFCPSVTHLYSQS